VDTLTAFWIDHTYDAAHATTDGASRYGDFLQQGAERFETIFGIYDDERILAAEFAAEAWRVATAPVMVPGFVRSHRRIAGAGVVRNQWDGSLVGAAELIVEWPRGLAGDRGWRRGECWRDWPSEADGSYIRPSDEDITKSSWLLPTAEALFTLDSAQLPERPNGPNDPALPGIATWTVTALVDQMNAVVVPILDRLERKA
jgi:hypothetical protein